MPLPPEMNVFQGEIGCDQRLMTPWKLDGGAVIAYAQICPTGSAVGRLANAPNEKLFGQRHKEVGSPKKTIREDRRRGIRRLIALAQYPSHSCYGHCLQYFSGISKSGFIDMGIYVCYGLMSIITYQSNPGLRLISCREENRQPTVFQVSNMAVRISQASRSGPLFGVGVISRNQFLAEG